MEARRQGCWGQGLRWRGPSPDRTESARGSCSSERVSSFRDEGLLSVHQEMPPWGLRLCCPTLPQAVLRREFSPELSLGAGQPGR